MFPKVQGESYDSAAYELIVKVSKASDILHYSNVECTTDLEFHLLPILYGPSNPDLQVIHHGILFHIPGMWLLDLV